MAVCGCLLVTRPISRFDGGKRVLLATSSIQLDQLIGA
jgi:hypothetical protein